MGYFDAENERRAAEFLAAFPEKEVYRMQQKGVNQSET